MKISACIITKNEESNIKKCINSLQSLINEIILVDTGSTDGTTKIAEELGATIYTFDWENDFSKAKNYAISKASGNWIIFLDADEFVSRESIKNVHEVIKIAENNKADAIVSKLVNVDSDIEKIITTVSTIRIFKNEEHIKYRGAIHERIVHENRKLKLLNANDQIKIIHTGYTKSEIAKKKKDKRNIQLLLKELEENSLDSDICFYLSESYMVTKNYQLALFYAKLVIQHNNSTLNVYEKNYANILKMMHILGKSNSELIELIKYVYFKYPEYPDFNVYYADYLVTQQRYNDAIKFYENAIDLAESGASKKEYRLGSVLSDIYQKLGDLKYKTHNFQDAVKIFTMLLRDNKYDYLTLNKLLSLLMEFESNHNIMGFILKLYDLNKPKDNILLYRAFMQNANWELVESVFQYFEDINQESQLDKNMLSIFRGNYKNATDNLLQLWEVKQETVYLNKAVVSAYLSNNNKQLEAVLEKIDELTTRQFIVFFNGDSNYIPELKGSSREFALEFMRNLIILSREDKILSRNELYEKNNLLNYIAEIFYFYGKYDNAFYYYNLYFQNNMDNDIDELLIVDYLYKMSYCSFKMGEFASSYELLRDANIISTKDYRVYELLVLVTEKYPNINVEDIFLKGLKEFPDSAFLKSILSKQGIKFNTIEKSNDFNYRIKFDFKELWDIGRGLVNEGKDDEAKPIFLFLLKNRTTESVASFILGEIANRNNKIEESKTYHENAFLASPDLARKLLSEDHPVYNYIYSKGNQKVVDKCPLCKTTNIKVHSCYNAITSIDFLAGFDPIRIWMKCDDCNHLFASSYPIEITEILSNSSFDFNMNTRKEFFPIIGDILSNIKKHSPGNRLLEIGVGAGEMTAVAKEYLFDVTGIDIRPIYAENISKLLDIPVYALDFLDFNDGSLFDVICMGDVIEHLKDPVSAIHKANRLLKKSGVLWISTPNFESGFSMVTKDRDPMWRIIEHLNYFSYRSLEKLLSRFNFKVVDYKVSSHYNGSMELIAIKLKDY